MNERIKELRKLLELTQAEFAEKIGVKRVTVTALERPGYTVTEQNIRIICDKFQVSRRWLETGKGEMYAPHKAPSLVDRVAAQYGLDDIGRAALEAYLDLPPELRAELSKYLRAVAIRAGYQPPGDKNAKNVPNVPVNAPVNAENVPVNTAREEKMPPKSSAANVSKNVENMTDEEIEAEAESYRQNLLAAQKGMSSQEEGRYTRKDA